jgi:hypothetical protein
LPFEPPSGISYASFTSFRKNPDGPGLVDRVTFGFSAVCQWKLSCNLSLRREFRKKITAYGKRPNFAMGETVMTTLIRIVDRMQWKYLLGMSALVGVAFLLMLVNVTFGR